MSARRLRMPSSAAILSRLAPSMMLVDDDRNDDAAFANVAAKGAQIVVRQRGQEIGERQTVGDAADGDGRQGAGLSIARGGRRRGTHRTNLTGHTLRLAGVFVSGSMRWVPRGRDGRPAIPRPGSGGSENVS